MSRIISGWIVAMAGFSGTAALMAGAAPALAADEIRTAYPDSVIIRRGPYPPPVAGSGYIMDGAEEAVPPFEVVRIIRSTGFEPLGAPVRRRSVYTISAINPEGDDGRVVLDAHTGRIMRFLPAEISDAEVVGAYGPPGLPPPTARTQRADVRTLRPPLPVPKVASRRPPLPAPQPEVARAEVAKSQSSAQPGQPAEPQTVGTVPPAAQQQAAAQPVPAAAAPRPFEAKPSVQLLPTQAMPPVQSFE